jgi:phospholipid transport system transporter-binding protein
MAEVVSHEDGKLSVEGAVLIDNVVAVVTRGVALFNREDLIIDLAQVDEVDSSAVSMLLEWRREASRRNCHLSFINMPRKLQNLAQLYGIGELIRSA